MKRGLIILLGVMVLFAVLLAISLCRTSGRYDNNVEKQFEEDDRINYDDDALDGDYD
jgi:hypothetical protein